ncbi:hypothetical protein LX36DRAFT_208746 [Colletotrichum falcatum]|nr:hypothetical protein LX36DRAFT_208746 [Colletotrichum falcatum]
MLEMKVCRFGCSSSGSDGIVSGRRPQVPLRLLQPVNHRLLLHIAGVIPRLSGLFRCDTIEHRSAIQGPGEKTPIRDNARHGTIIRPLSCPCPDRSQETTNPQFPFSSLPKRPCRLYSRAPLQPRLQPSGLHEYCRPNDCSEVYDVAMWQQAGHGSDWPEFGGIYILPVQNKAPKAKSNVSMRRL